MIADIQVSRPTATKQERMLSDLSEFLLRIPCPVSLLDSTPSHVCAFLAYRDTRCTGHTVVHDLACIHVGNHIAGSATSEHPCSCPRTRQAAASVRVAVSSLKTAFSALTFSAAPWSPASATGNPIDSPAVAAYVHAVRIEQLRAGVQVKQAVPLSLAKLRSLVMGLWSEMPPLSPLERLCLYRDIACYTLMFATMTRGLQACSTLASSFTWMPARAGILMNYCYGKTLRSGKVHAIGISRLFLDGPVVGEPDPACPIWAMESYHRVSISMGHSLHQGYLFPAFASSRRSSAPATTQRPVGVGLMAERFHFALFRFALLGGETLHSFRGGGAIERTLSGDALERVMQIAYWRCERTARYYLRLVRDLYPSRDWVERWTVPESLPLTAFGVHPPPAV
jgi:hypothetical protein